jgi:hypothetical protein
LRRCASDRDDEIAEARAATRIGEGDGLGKRGARPRNGVFTTEGTNAPTVDTLPTTTFTGVSGVTGLTMDQPVIIDGELFNTTTGVVAVGGPLVQTTGTAAATRVATQ